MDTNDFSIFRERLRQLIYSNGMNAKSFAEKMNISVPTITRYLGGKRSPELVYVIKIADYFGVSVDWLVGFSDDKTSMLPQDTQEMIRLYSLATPEDRNVIRVILDKYNNSK